MNKGTYLLFGFAIVLFLIIIAIGFIMLSPSLAPHPLPTPTPLPTIKEGNVQYDLNAQHKLLQIAKNPPTLSSSDLEAKKKIIALVPSGSEVVYQSTDFTIYYVNGADLFQGEILTTNITKAKREVVAWFKTQGMSQQGICGLPITFYLNYDVSQKLQYSNIVFSPLPEGC